MISDETYRKALKKREERKRLVTCLKAGICPECGEDLEEGGNRSVCVCGTEFDIETWKKAKKDNKPKKAKKH